MKDLPIYDITLAEWDAGVYAISLVDRPAIESDFLHFNKQEVASWMLSDEEKREVVGAVLIPDKLIYRKLEDGTEFFIKFTAEVISQINEKMKDTSGDKYFTIQHELDARASVKMTENWIKETESDKSTGLGLNEPIGTLFAKVKINSDFIWNSIKEGKLNGFSVELDASLIQTELNTNIKNNEMDFNSMYENSLSVKDKELLFNGELDKGTILFHVEGADKEKKLVPFTGEFTTENTEYTVEQGLVTNVNNITLSIENKIESLSNELKELKALLQPKEPKEGEETAEQKLDAILTKMEEDRLKLAQNKADQNKSEDEAVVVEPQRIDTNLLASVRDWGSKWNKKTLK